MILFLKGNVRGYVRKDGVFVSPHFRRAAAFAAERHKGQLREDGKTPYIAHPLAVAAILHDEAGIRDPATLVSAVLHDTLEDTNTTHDELALLFGREVADTVRELTNDPSMPRERRKQAQVEKARRMSPRAAQVKVADKISNLRDIVNAPPADWSHERKLRYYEHARDVAHAVSYRHPVLDRLFSTTYLTGISRLRS